MVVVQMDVEIFVIFLNWGLKERDSGSIYQNIQVKNDKDRTQYAFYHAKLETVQRAQGMPTQSKSLILRVLCV